MHFGRRLALGGRRSAALVSAGARADVLHATYRVSLIGLPIGAANLKAELTPDELLDSRRRQTDGSGEALFQCAGRFDRRRRRSSRPCLARDIRHHCGELQHDPHHPHGASGQHGHRRRHSPPFEDKPDRVPLGPRDQQNVVDPIGAFIFPAPASGPMLSPAACNRKIPIFDGYTRFDIDLSYVGERNVIGQRLRRAGRGLRLSLRADLGPSVATGRRPNSWPTTRTSKCGSRRSRATAC